MLLIPDSKILNISILKGLFRINKLKIGKLKKQELIDAFNKYRAINIIQKSYRNHFYRNATDHITLEKVDHPCFIFRTKSGKNYFYSFESIISYIMKTGNTKDPMTRTQYSDEELLRLDKSAKKYLPQMKFKSTLKIKNNPSYARRIRNRENEILSFQMRLTELKDSINIVIEYDVFLWNLDQEPILINDVEYLSINSYINILLYEFKIILVNLHLYSPDLALTFKNEFVDEL